MGLESRAFLWQSIYRIMKKLLLIILLTLAFSLGFFSSSSPYLFWPQKAEALFGSGIVYDPKSDLSNMIHWLEEFANDAKAYALEAKKYEQMISDYAQFTKQTIELVQSTKTLGGLACYAEKNLGVNVRGILGSYSLGGLTPIADKILGGAGVKDLLCDQIGGCIGTSGILQGGLSGLYTRTDLISSTIEQVGVRIPTAVAGKLADIGVFDTRNIARIFAGKECPCVDSVCPPDPIRTPAGQSSCYNPNNSIIKKTEDNIDKFKPAPAPRPAGDYHPEDNGAYNMYDNGNLYASVLGLTVVPDPDAKPSATANCKKRIPPVSKDDMAKILWVLDREGLHVSAEQAAKLIESGALDVQTTLQKYIANPGENNSGTSQDPNASSSGNQEDVTGRPPCKEWGSGDTEGICLKYKILF